MSYKLVSYKLSAGPTLPQLTKNYIIIFSVTRYHGNVRFSDFVNKIGRDKKRVKGKKNLICLL